MDLWLKNGAFFAAEKRPGVATLANGSHAFLHGDMGQAGLGTTGPGALKIGMLFVWLLAH